MSHDNGIIRTLHGKIKISGKLKLLTGMHIGASKEFAEIGAVDLIVIRDPLSQSPVIPGSSIKGKMRTLLAKCLTDGPFLEKHDEDPSELLRLFGASAEKYEESRLQFLDCMLNEESKNQLGKLNLDLELTEIKFENTINRITAQANPRQIERIPAGTEFDFALIYNLLDLKELSKDLDNIFLGLEMLQNDYIGGHGSRGYGRLSFTELNYETIWERENGAVKIPEDLKGRLEAINKYDLLQAV